MAELIQRGISTPLVQNRVYALPARGCNLFSDSTPTLEQSTIESMATKVALTLTNGQVAVAGGFIRSTTVGTIVICSVN